MAHRRGGEKCDLGYNHGQFLDDLGRGVGNLKRTGEARGTSSLRETLRRIRSAQDAIGKTAERVVTRTERVVSEMMDCIEEGLGIDGSSVGASEPTFKCVEVRGKASIRIPLEGREHGGINQLACPKDASERCAGCIVDLASREGFPRDRFAGVIAVASGDMSYATAGETR